MHKHQKDIIRILSKGDTSLFEAYFKKRGGRKYLENITLILIHTLPAPLDEKEALYEGFIEVLNGMEKRIQHQQQGSEIIAHALRHGE